MTTLIVGASGLMARPVIERLLEAGAGFRALSSNARSAERLRAAGCPDVVTGDLRDGDDMARVTQDVRTVLYVPPVFMADEADIARRFIATAAASGVEKFVFLSVLHPQMTGMHHHHQKLLIEEAVIESGMRFAILQPAMLMQNLRREWRQVVDHGILARPYRTDLSMAVVDADDVGEAAFIALTTGRLDGGVFELCGDALTTRDMAAILADELGRPVEARESAIEDWEKGARAGGFDDTGIEIGRKMLRHYQRHGLPGGTPLVLSAILGRAPNDYRTFVRHYAAEQAR
ncbi:SDR family oxidoreductase [Microbaculum marinum]|uniref:NmrA family NAD(P)-binding protein n=1 Tax=Microbaculum marinum TaxID=1764581 RepID=A0AAW9RQL6_9HYPH